MDGYWIWCSTITGKHNTNSVLSMLFQHLLENLWSNNVESRYRNYILYMEIPITCIAWIFMRRTQVFYAMRHVALLNDLTSFNYVQYDAFTTWRKFMTQIRIRRYRFTWQTLILTHYWLRCIILWLLKGRHSKIL